MAAFSYQHPFPRPFFIDSVFPQQSTTTTTVTDISAPTGLFMEEPAGILSSSFPQFYPPELFLQQGVYGSFDSSAGGLPQNYGFSNDCSIDDGDNVEEEEASVVTRKQSTDGGGGHSSTTESSGEQVTQFKSAPPPSAAAMDLHTKKRKKMTTVVVKPNNNKNNLSNASSHLTSAHSKEAAREAGKSSKKAKKSCDVEVEEETKKKKNQKQGKTGEEVKQQSKKAQVQQRKKGAAAADDKELPPTGYIHVRARRGQATDSHSLAERARREKISERMKLLQHLVPGCDKVTGKALMLDEIINYIQSLQSQVEFLSMKLASVNPLFYEFGLDLDGLMVRPESQRLSSNNNVVASPPLPPPGQQCNPTTATTATVPHQPHQHTSNFATTTNAAAAAFPLIGATTNSTSAIFAGQRQGDFSQSQDNGGNLLWDMEVEVGRQKLVNQSGFGIGSTTTTTTTNNNFCSSFQ